MNEDEIKSDDRSEFHPEVYKLVRRVFEEGLELARETVESKKQFISHHYRYPEVSYWGSKDAHIRIMSSFDLRLPINYVDTLKIVLRAKSNSPDSSITLSAWEELLDFAIKDSRMGPYFRIRDEDVESDPDRWARHFRQLREKLVFDGILSMIDTYIHNKNYDFNEKLFDAVYRQWERSIFAPELPFEMVVPILRVRFDFDRLDLSENARIERMSDKFQISRCLNDHDAYIPSEEVARLATHAFHFGLLTIENNSYEQREGILDSRPAYSDLMQNVDNFFAALKAVTGIGFGYAQIVAKPIGWSGSSEASVPVSYPIRVRAYPDNLEDQEWIHKEPPAPLSEKSCREIGPVFKAIQKSSKLGIAARRLNSVIMRKDEADSILDVAIGLETLLGGDGQGEVTYKLKTRLAALCLLEPFSGYTPWEVRKLCGKVYDFRSKVAHGSGEAKKSRLIKNREGVDIPAVEIGVELLKYAIRILSKHEKYLTPENIDEFILDVPSSPHSPGE